MSTPKAAEHKSRPVAEIRAKIVNQGGSYPFRVQGRDRVFFFHKNVKNDPWFYRRYVFGEGDAENGIFPMAQADEDMAHLQTIPVAPLVVCWQLLSPEQVKAEADVLAESLRAHEESEAHRIAKLREAEHGAEAAKDAVDSLRVPAERPGRADIAAHTPSNAPSRMKRAPSINTGKKPAGLAAVDALP